MLFWFRNEIERENLLATEDGAGGTEHLSLQGTELISQVGICPVVANLNN